MSPFVNRFHNDQWVLPITGMCLVLGFMISLAWVTERNRSSRVGLLASDQRTRVSAAAVDIQAFEDLSDQVTKLQLENTKLQNTMATEGKSSQVLNESLQEIKKFAGLTEIEGPGVMVTLKDKPSPTSSMGGVPNPDSIIHDLDVLRVVNELFASGAEAVAVNDHRVSVGSSFRCVGPTILVNDVRIASPVFIRAIGDVGPLYGGLTLPGGILEEIRTADPSMAQIEKVKNMRLPAFVGSTSKAIGKVPKNTGVKP